MPNSAGAAASEYTRILGRVNPAQAAAAATSPSPATQPATEKPQRSYLPIIIAINIVVIATLSIVLYVVMHR